MFEWENFSEDDSKRLQNKIKSLIELATVKVEVIRPEIEARSNLKYGRLYLTNFVQSFEVSLHNYLYNII